MVIIRLMGGLGNQLQQYALYRKFISLGRDAYLDTSWYQGDNQKEMKAPRPLELDLFAGADYRTASPGQVEALTGSGSVVAKILRKTGLKKSTYVREEQMYYPWLLESDDIYLEGYWGAEKYYADILPALRNELAFDVLAMNPETVRIASDIENRNKNVRYTCSVHICANSSFSFWGVRLDPGHDPVSAQKEAAPDEISGNGIICVRPTIHKNSQVFKPEVMRDLWAGWTFVDPSGRVM